MNEKILSLYCILFPSCISTPVTSDGLVHRLYSCALYLYLDAAVPPWVGYNEEETIQQQILALSAVRKKSHVSPEKLTPFFVIYQIASSGCRTREISCETLLLVSSSTSTWSTCIPWLQWCWRKISCSIACALTWFLNSQYYPLYVCVCERAYVCFDLRVCIHSMPFESLCLQVC